MMTQLVEPLQGTAQAHYEAGRFTEAADAFLALAALQPTNPVPPFNAGAALRHAGRPRAALEACTAALDLNPNLAAAQRNRATCRW